MRAALALALLAGCTSDMGAPQPWVAAGSISGTFAPEIGPALSGSTAPRGGAPVSTRPLRVVTFNVQHGENVDGLAAALGEHPDLSSAGLVLLQEEEDHPSEGSSRAARLAERLGLAYVYLPYRAFDGFTHGLSILSAFPIVNVREMELPHGDIDVPRERRIAAAADILVGGTTLHVIDVHLYTTLNVTDRILQLRPAVLDAPDTVLVAGDFNTNDFLWAGGALPVLPAHSAVDTQQAPILDSYMRALGFDTPCAGVGATAHAIGLEFRLDAFFTRGLAVTPGHVARDVNVSDHWPVWIDVTLP